MQGRGRCDAIYKSFSKQHFEFLFLKMAKPSVRSEKAFMCYSGGQSQTMDSVVEFEGLVNVMLQHMLDDLFMSYAVRRRLWFLQPANVHVA